MIKSFFIKSLLIKTYKNKKKLKFFTEFSLFLIMAALISSAISIYFEIKIANHNNKLSNLEFEEIRVQDWMKTSASVNVDNRDYKFIYYLTSENEKITISKSRYYFQLLNWYPITIDLALEDALKVGNNKLHQKYKIKDKIKKNEKIKDYIQFVYDKLGVADSDEYTDRFDIKKEENYFKSISEKERKYLFDSLDELEKIMMEVGLYYQENNNIIDQKKVLIQKQIEKDSKLSVTLIFLAFFLQILIFSIVQIFELRELR